MDIALNWNNYGADIELASNDLEQGNDIKTAILTSLFSDARAQTDELKDPNDNPRGWWSDFTDDFGSLLWLIHQEKNTIQTAERAKKYCLAALNWLIVEGIASKVIVEYTRIEPQQLFLSITVTRGSNQAYDYAWKTINNDTYTFNNTAISLNFV